MERKKRSKGRGWESCYVKKIYGTFGVEMRAYGQKLVKFCTHTHTRLSYSSIDITALMFCSCCKHELHLLKLASTTVIYVHAILAITISPGKIFYFDLQHK